MTRRPAILRQTPEGHRTKFHRPCPAGPDDNRRPTLTFTQNVIAERMTDLTVSGTVTDGGRATTKILVLNVLITLWREDKPISHVYEADIATNSSGAFSGTVNVKPCSTSRR